MSRLTYRELQAIDRMPKRDRDALTRHDRRFPVEGLMSRSALSAEGICGKYPVIFP